MTPARAKTVEAVALALLNERRRFGGRDLIACLTDLEPHQYRDELRYAQAAIAAHLAVLREPSIEQIAVAWKIIAAEKPASGVARLGPGLGIREIYTAMIDGAGKGEG